MASASTDAAVAFPLALSPEGEAAMVSSYVSAAEQLIEELLFTDPGERLNRPTLGCGVIELVFGALTDELRASTQFQVASRLQQWLGDVIRVISVTVGGTGSELDVTVSYQLVGSAEARQVTFTR
jgi:phage baseplate assembly protein W